MSTTAKTPTAPEPEETTAHPGEQGTDEQGTDEQDMDSIARKAEARATDRVEKARKANAEAEKALAEIAKNPLMVNGLGKAAKEAHQAAAGQDERLQNLLQRIHEHFNPRTPEEG